MANTQIRDSEHTCPKCGIVLKQKWSYQDIGTLAGGKEWQPIGKAYCPSGHTFEWSLAGPM